MSGDKMKVIIVEDEFLAQQELTWLINTHSQMEIVGTFDDGLDVLKFLQHNKVDAIFLDINIPSLDGVLLAQNISQFAHKPFIVFITAWKEHAVEAFELEAFDYILKPYQESRIINMLQKLTGAWQQQQQVSAGSGQRQSSGKTTRSIWLKMSGLSSPASTIFTTRKRMKR
jgi:two-component system LytT family response regulator